MKKKIENFQESGREEEEGRTSLLSGHYGGEANGEDEDASEAEPAEGQVSKEEGGGGGGGGGGGTAASVS